MPQRLPAFGWTLRERPLLRSAILIAESGHVWVREYGFSRSAPAHWSVFTKDGEYVGLVDMPVRFEPFQIGADGILGKWADDDGVEYIQLFALDRLSAR